MYVIIPVYMLLSLCANMKQYAKLNRNAHLIKAVNKLLVSGCFGPGIQVIRGVRRYGPCRVIMG